jgi:uncharacterized repeat protein (TIGR01451 family)
MKRRSGKNDLRANSFLVLLAIAVLFTAVPSVVQAKSLYVIADILGSTSSATQPLQAYNVEPDGTLTFQVEHRIPHRGLGGVGMAIDSDTGYLLITYEHSDEIELVDARTMTRIGATVAPDSYNLAGIVYDHKKKLVYCSNRNWSSLYVYDWDPDTTTLTHVPGSPFTLKRASAFGLALDEIDDLLYIANGTDKITVYSTNDWKLVNTITLSRDAISVAVDVQNGYLYTGGGFIGNMYLTQYHLATGTEAEVQVEPDAGVMGLAVDPDTGLVYLNTGVNNAPGGDNLQVYDTKLNQIDIIYDIGNPTALVVPGRDISYNPLNLRKTLLRGGSSSPSSDVQSVGAGATITYGIHFDNYNEFNVTDVIVTDRLPAEVTFIAADDDGVNGHYDPKSHTYQWLYPSLPSGTEVVLELTVEVDKNVELGTILTNAVTINSNQTAPTTTHLDVLVESSALNLTKRIAGVAEGQIAWVDADELMTYTICFDNRDNDFPVTNVSVVDYLPNEVSFVNLGANTRSGKYDATRHTYTWTFPSLEPGAAVCLNVNARVNKVIEPDTTFTNSVTVDSDQTPLSTASVEATTYHNPINLRKSIVGVEEGKIPLVSRNEIITYEVYFDNMGSDSPVHNVTLIDVLPREVGFVKAVDDRQSGQYDPTTHTYTWFYGTLSGKVGTYLELVVRVNEDAPSETLITNYVTLDSDETRPRTASADAMTKYRPLNIRKEVVGDVIGATAYADPGDTVTYRICFHNDNAGPVTNVLVIDELPREVVFVSATGDKDYGWYDQNSHTYTWSYKSLPPGSSTCVTLTVKVKEDVPRDKIIVNTVKIKSDQTDESQNPPGDNEINTGEEPLPLERFSILPEIIRDTGTNYEIQVTAFLPEGIGKDDVEDVPPILYLPQPYSGKISATRQIVYGTATRAKVIALFDRMELLNAIGERGQFTLTVVGKLKKGKSWYGRDTVYITGFAGP